MQRSFDKIIKGYNHFKAQFKGHEKAFMEQLATEGQKPEIMVVSCCDSRVDPSIILQCKPGDLFIARNVANLIPPYENDEFHHGTSAALEFGVCYLNVKHLIIWGHSQCGGIAAHLNREILKDQNDFLGNWIDIIKEDEECCNESNQTLAIDKMAKKSLHLSYNNCLSFPWIKERVENSTLSIHRWFFDIEHAELYAFDTKSNDYLPL